MLPTIIRNKVLFRTEDSSGAVSIVEDTMPAGAPGPPLHRHGFDEAFDVLDGELTFRVRDQLSKAHAGELIFAPRGVPPHACQPHKYPSPIPTGYHPGRIRTRIWRGHLGRRAAPRGTRERDRPAQDRCWEHEVASAGG